MRKIASDAGLEAVVGRLEGDQELTQMQDDHMMGSHICATSRYSHIHLAGPEGELISRIPTLVVDLAQADVPSSSLAIHPSHAQTGRYLSAGLVI